MMRRVINVFPRWARLLGALLIVFAVLATTSYATTAHLVGWGEGMSVRHDNLPKGGSVWAGTLIVRLGGDDGVEYEVYCIELEKDWCQGADYGQGPDIDELHIVWILNNYYPHVPDEPSGLSDERRAAAVQLAIWHFSDGLDISSGGYPSDVFDAARAIVDAAEEVSVPLVPDGLTLTPSSAAGTVGEEHTVTATVRDQNGDPLSGETVSFTVTGANAASGSAVTDSAGEASFTYQLTSVGEDSITASVSYTVPVGLRWILEGCQQLIMAEEAPSELTATATLTAEEKPPTPTPPQSPVGGVALPSSPVRTLEPGLVGAVALLCLALLGAALFTMKRGES